MSCDCSLIAAGSNGARGRSGSFIPNSILRPCIGGFLALLLWCSPVGAAARVDLPSDRDPELFPYVFEQVTEELPLFGVIDARGDGRLALFSYSDLTLGDQSSWIAFHRPGAAEIQPLSQHNARTHQFNSMLILDIDSTPGQELVFTYLSRDSLFVEILDPAEDVLFRRCVVAVSDTNRSGSIDATLLAAAATDLNADSCAELILVARTGWDDGPRALYCLDWRRDSLLWRFDIAGHVYTRDVAIVIGEDSADISLVFATWAPCNGRTAADADDCHSYLYCLDAATGAPRWTRELGDQLPAISLVSGYSARLSRPLIFTLAGGNDSAAEHNNRLIVYDTDGNLTDSIIFPGRAMYLDVLYDRPADSFLFAAASNDGWMQIFDASLHLQADIRSEAALRGLGSVDLLGDGVRRCLVSLGSDRIVLLNDRFRPEAIIPRAASYVVPGDAVPGVDLIVRYDGRTRFLAARANSPLMVLLLRYRMYLLFLAGILATATAVTLVFQRRTRRNLEEIRRQKGELERTHQELIDTQQKLVEAEKFKQAKDIAGAFAHEIRNALFPARLALHRLGNTTSGAAADPVPSKNQVQDLNRAITRAIDLTNEISQYAKLEAAFRPETVLLGEAVAGVVKDNAALLADRNITVTTDGPPDLAVRFGRLHLSIVLTNLLRNSIDALADRSDGRIEIVWQQDPRGVRLLFCDNGPGIPEDIRDRVFDAFFTTRPSSGTGLGLATVRRLVDLNSGDISIEDCPDRGCCLALVMPAPNPHPEAL